MTASEEDDDLQEIKEAKITTKSDSPNFLKESLDEGFIGGIGIGLIGFVGGAIVTAAQVVSDTDVTWVQFATLNSDGMLYGHLLILLGALALFCTAYNMGWNAGDGVRGGDGE